MKPNRALMRKRAPRVQLFSFKLPDRNKENEITKDSRQRTRGEKRKAVGNIEDTSDDSYSSSASKRIIPLRENLPPGGAVVSLGHTASEEPVTDSKSSGVYSAETQSNSDNVLKNYPDVVPEVSQSLSQKIIQPSDNTTPLSDHNNKNLSHTVSKIVNRLDSAETLENLPQLRNEPEQQPELQEDPEKQSEFQEDSEKQSKLQDLLEKQPKLQDLPEKQPEFQQDPEKQPELQEDPQKEPELEQQHSEEQCELEVRKPSVERHANSTVVDQVESSKNSSSTTHRNLDPKNDLNRVKVMDKDIVLVQDNAPQTNLPFDSELDRSTEETEPEPPAHDSTLVADRDSSSDSDQEDIQFTRRPVEAKTFLISGKLLDKLRRKKERPIHEVETGNLKVKFGKGTSAFSVRAVKPPKQTPTIPEDRNILFYNPPRNKRTVTEATNLEVALTVVMENFDATQKQITENSVRSTMKVYEEAVKKDIMAMIKKMVKLKKVEKEIRKVQRYNKQRSDEIGRALKEEMRERMRRKIRSQIGD